MSLSQNEAGAIESPGELDVTGNIEIADEVEVGAKVMLGTGDGDWGDLEVACKIACEVDVMPSAKVAKAARMKPVK